MSEVEFSTGEQRKHLQQLDDEICKIVVGKSKEDINAYIKFSSACRQVMRECSASYSRCDYLLSIAQKYFDKHIYDEIRNYNVIVDAIDESLSAIIKENEKLCLTYSNVKLTINKLRPSFDYDLMKVYFNDLINIEERVLSLTIKLNELVKLMSPTVIQPQYFSQMKESTSTLNQL